MYAYLFLFLNLFFAVNSEAKRSLEERYIELLPEGDKLAFLGKVARRIQDEVTTNVKPDKPELLLEDDALEPHSEYVNKVLKEEAIKFVDQKDTRRASNETSNDNSQNEQSADNVDDKRTTSEDLTLREKNTEEVTTADVLSEHETESINNNSEVSNVVNDSKIEALYIDDINITVPTTELLLTENNEITILDGLVTSTIKNIEIIEDEPKIDEGIPKEDNQLADNITSNDVVKSNLFRTLDNSNDYLSIQDDTFKQEESQSKKKDLSNNHEVYEVVSDQNEFQRKETAVYYPHQEKSNTLHEEPYYIPVYNYNIQNAFYNAKNRLGPNEDNLDSADENLEDKQYQRGRDNYNLNLDYEIDIPKQKYNQHRHQYKEKNVKKSPELSAKRIITTKQPTHGNDYFDLDYYFGRNVENDKNRNIDNEEERNVDNVKEKNVENDNENNSENTDRNMKSKILSGRFKIIGNGKGLNKLNSVVPEENALNMKTKDEKVLIFIKVINDMIRGNSDALMKYDWLGTTIDILAATDKLKTVLREDRLGVSLNSQDKQLLGYIEYIFENAKYPQATGNIDANNNNYDNDRDEKDSNRERSKNQKKVPQFLIDVAKVYAKLSLTEDTDEIYPKNWKDVTEDDTSNRIGSDFKYVGRNKHKDLEDFMTDIDVKLYDLHTTIRDIAVNTKYKDQNWFNDIKEKYLLILTKEKSLQILLHIMSAGLLDVIEASADRGVEFDFQKYIRENENVVNRTIQRLKIVITLLDELNA